jgi:predicted  nucleic acid-binding Zn-ribbon protein
MKKEEVNELRTNIKFYKEDLETISIRNNGLVKEAFDSNTNWVRTGNLKKAIAKNNKEIDSLNRKIRESELKLEANTKKRSIY